MFEALAKSLEAGLSLWKSKEARKYLDQVIRLKQDWHEEYAKEISDDAVLDKLELDLRIIAMTFSSAIGAENAAKGS